MFNLGALRKKLVTKSDNYFLLFLLMVCENDVGSGKWTRYARELRGGLSARRRLIREKYCTDFFTHLCKSLKLFIIDPPAYS